MNIGTIENAKLVIFRSPFNPDHFYYVADDKGLDWSGFYATHAKTLPKGMDSAWARVYGHANLDENDAPFWMIYSEDCFDPPVFIVRADDIETAIDIAVDEFEGLQVDSDCYGGEAEFEKALDDGTVGVTGSGGYYDSESMRAREIAIFRIEF